MAKVNEDIISLSTSVFRTLTDMLTNRISVTGHKKILTVWYAVSSHSVIDTYFFEDKEAIAKSVTSDRYVRWLQNCTHLNTENMWFQQQSMATILQLFGKHTISLNGDTPTPSNFLNLTFCTFFL